MYFSLNHKVVGGWLGSTDLTDLASHRVLECI